MQELIQAMVGPSVRAELHNPYGIGKLTRLEPLHRGHAHNAVHGVKWCLSGTPHSGREAQWQAGYQGDESPATPGS